MLRLRFLTGCVFSKINVNVIRKNDKHLQIVIFTIFLDNMFNEYNFQKVVEEVISISCDGLILKLVEVDYAKGIISQADFEIYSTQV